MKITLGKLKSSEPALAKLSNSSLPYNLAYRFSKMLKIVSVELNELEELRKKLVEKYGVDNGEGNLAVSNENLDNFIQDLNPLLLEEVDLPFEKIKASLLPESINLTPIEVAQLEDFINFEE